MKRYHYTYILKTRKYHSLIWLAHYQGMNFHRWEVTIAFQDLGGQHLYFSFSELRFALTFIILLFQRKWH